jgi:hypothetical protein
MKTRKFFIMLGARLSAASFALMLSVFALAGCDSEPAYYSSPSWPPEDFDYSQPPADITNGVYTAPEWSGMELSISGSGESGRFELRDYSDKTTSDGPYRIAGSRLALRFNNGLMEGKIWTFNIDSEEQFSGGGLTWILTQSAFTELPRSSGSSAGTASGPVSYSLSGTYINRTGAKVTLSPSGCTLDLGGAGSSQGVFFVIGDNLNMTFATGMLRGSTVTYKIIDNDTLQSDTGAYFSR